MYGAEIYVNAPGESGDGFETLWRATRPTSEGARTGVFVVGVEGSFLREDQPLRRKLPDGFHVGVTELVDGKPDPGQADWVAPSRLRGAELAAGEYLTPDGDVVTRAQINAQALCSDPITASGR